jgi:hypothetical protein
MKPLGACLLLIAFVAITKPAEAQTVVYQGTLVAGEPFTINVDNTASGNNRTILTVSYRRSGTMFDIITVPPASHATLHPRPIPRGTRLVAIEVAPPLGVNVGLETTQGPSSFPAACVGGCTLVFDVE